MRMVVVLPAPLSPRSAKMEPFGISRSSPARAFFLPNCLDRPRISIAGSMRAFLRSWRLKGCGERKRPLFGSRFITARGFPVGSRQFFVHELADLFRRQGTGGCFAERLADAAAHNFPALAGTGQRGARRDFHAPAALGRHDAAAF